VIYFQCFLRRGALSGLSTAQDLGPWPPKAATATAANICCRVFLQIVWFLFFVIIVENFQVSFSIFSHSGLATRYRDIGAQREIKITGSSLAVRFVFTKGSSITDVRAFLPTFNPHHHPLCPRLSVVYLTTPSPCPCGHWLGRQIKNCLNHTEKDAPPSSCPRFLTYGICCHFALVSPPIPSIVQVSLFILSFKNECWFFMLWAFVVG